MWHRCKASSRSAALALACTLACASEAGDPASAGEATSEAASAGSTTAATSAAATDAPTTEVASTGTSTGETSTGEPGASESSAGETTMGADPCEDSVLTWENFGEPFMLSWCTGCHHSQLPTTERACAPCNANFDTHAGTSERAPVIALRVLDWQSAPDVKPMPPAAIVPEEELALLREWLECGAIGPESGTPGPLCPDPEVTDADCE